MASHPHLPSIEERKRLRAPISLAVDVTGPSLARTQGEMIDLSDLGCRVRLVMSVAVGSFLTIEVEAFTKFDAWVVWRNGQEIGLDFAHPLPAKVTQHLLSLGAR